LKFQHYNGPFIICLLMAQSSQPAFSNSNNVQSEDVPIITVPVSAPVESETQDITMHAPLASNNPPIFSWAQASAAVALPPLGAPMAPIPEDMDAPPLPAFGAAPSGFGTFQSNVDMMPSFLPSLQATPSAIHRAFSDKDYLEATPIVGGATPMAMEEAAGYLALHPTATRSESETYAYAQVLHISPQEAAAMLWDAVQASPDDKKEGDEFEGEELVVNVVSCCTGTYCDTLGVTKVPVAQVPAQVPAADAPVAQPTQFATVSYNKQHNRYMRHSGDRLKDRLLRTPTGPIQVNQLTHTMELTPECTECFVVSAPWKGHEAAIPLTRLADATREDLPLIMELRVSNTNAEGVVVREKHIIPVLFRNTGCTSADCTDMTHDVCQAAKSHTSIANVKVTRDPVTRRLRAVVIREYLMGFAGKTSDLEQSMRDKGL
jgi:hypothetical protein